MHFIDTHCHIVSGVDDGAASVDVSLEMAQLAIKDGISTIIATPHIVEGIYDGVDLQKRLDALGIALVEKEIDLKLVAGAEVPMSACMAGDKQILEGLTLGDGPCLLMETSDTSYDQVARAAYQVRLCGLLPVLAHPERTAFVQKDPGRLEQLLGNGDVFCQITAASFEGLFGRTVQKTAWSMLKSGMVHLVASDAHSAGRRSPHLSTSHSLIIKSVGEEKASVIFQENPQRVLAGNKLLQAPAGTGGEVSIRGFLARLLGR
ncbi:MAG: CpsB/CapC family capsule biosynthesis tyrosine phosphatase [Thermoleophilia bacterium]